MRRASLWAALATVLVLVLTIVPAAQAADHAPVDAAGISRLKAEKGADTMVALNRLTGAARFVSVRGEGDLSPGAADDFDQRARAFFDNYGSVFGIRDAASELALVRTSPPDNIGATHVSYVQRYQGVPVFGGVMHAHFDRQGRLRTVNGSFVPQIDVSTTPTETQADVEAAAVRHVQRQIGPTAGDLSSRGAVLYVFREGLVRGVPGRDRLVYEVEVVGQNGTRELVYVNAASAKVVDQITGNETAGYSLFRRSYDGANSGTAPGPNYPGSPFWIEGNSFPTGTTEADNMIAASAETFNLYETSLGFSSASATFFPNTSGEMHSIFNRGWSCPNASWQGTYISFCPGFTADDVTSHEWSHAFTDFTHNLIYQWQSGALNESYSDIFGEAVDLLNGRQSDSPGPLRTDGACSTFWGGPPPVLTITSPASIAGNYTGSATSQEPTRPVSVTGTLAKASPIDGCSAISGVSGKIAIIDWANGACGSVTKTTNAFNAGAIGAVIVADPSGLIGLTGSASIATIQVTNSDGAKLKANLPATGTITLDVGTDASYRWLMGEDVNYPGFVGALRDMWNPVCFDNPGKVSDEAFYVCDGNFDGGGVHINSGIPNHAFALLVDGGTYNGQTITGIGLTKAAHIYFRAESVYQVPTSNFVDHADALEMSCADLTGVAVNQVTTDGSIPGTQTIVAGDCTELSKALLAVEMRDDPAFCGFQPLLAPNPPPLCGGAGTLGVFSEDFEAGFASQGWSVSHAAVNGGTFTSRDWEELAAFTKGGRTSGMAFGVDPDTSSCANDQAGILYLDSPVIGPFPAGVAPFLAFDHYVATEPDWDGGTIQVNVNGGGWQDLATGDFTFNPYNSTFLPPSTSNNPLAGQDAFTGTDGGSNGGSWAQSQVNLASYAGDGDSVQLRFELSTDCATGVDGWYVDNVIVDSCVIAGMISPNPGSQFTSRAETFVWSTGQGVTRYWLQAGTKPGGREFFDAEVFGTTQTVSGLPNDGSTVWVRLWSFVGGAWRRLDYQYTAVVPVPSQIHLPLPGTKLSSDTETFQWDVDATTNLLWVGDKGPGSKNIFQATVSGLAQAVSGLPTDGRQVWVRLWSYSSGKWVYIDYYYVASGDIGCLFTSELITNPSFSSNYAGWSKFGNAFGAPALLSGFIANFGCITSGGAPFPEFAGISQDITIPQGAAELGFYLYWYDDNPDIPTDYFTASIDGWPVFSQFGGTAFSDWVTDGSFYGFDLKIANVTPFADGGVHTLAFEGNTSGGNDPGSAFGCGNRWLLAFPSMAACSPISEILTPTPSSTLTPSTTQTFTWSAGIGVTANYLQIGRLFKGSELFNGPVSGGTQTVSGLPTDGGPLWVRLWSKIAGSWYKADYSYTTADGRAMITNVGTLPDSTTFTWDVNAATALYLQVGTGPTGTASRDLFNSPVTGTSQLVDLSSVSGGATVYVRLWSYIGGVWQRSESTFTKAP